MSRITAPNLNHLWASLIVEELIRNGVDYFCLSPGSRSSPLAYAVAKNKNAKTFIHFDERGTGFHALGYTSATGKPSCLITTSGTAVANLFPSIIEASKKKLPLIILTADRPPELRLTGANQTIDQVKIFGDYVRFFFDMSTPTLDIKPEFVLTTIDQAVYRSQGELPGPVHLNCMFREPLAPIKEKINLNTYLQSISRWLNSSHPYTSYVHGHTSLNPSSIKMIATKINQIKSGLIAVGKLKNDGKKMVVLKLAETLGWPIFADITSELRFGQKSPNIITYFDQILTDDRFTRKHSIDGVLQFGGRLTSKRFYDFLKMKQPKEYMMVLNHPLRNDPSHNVTTRIHSKIENFCQKILPAIKRRKNLQLLTILQKLNKKTEEVLEKQLSKEKLLTEVHVARMISQAIPKEHALFMANSLPIREMDMYAAASATNIKIGANRGASGIDGTIATAAGFSQGLQKHVTLLIGDLAFLYDLNSLTMLDTLKHPMTIVLINNNGGGIFNFLPIAASKDIFEKFFVTPHHLTFEAIAQQFSLQHVNPKTPKEFMQSYNEAAYSKGSTLIEIQTNRGYNFRFQNELKNKMRKNLK